ncbi:MAG: CDP-alcohol phosphatidyltransferase family protein [Eubacteriaceae bacterium]|nr:CDP-alcohol phosphatidyltransferase family protein [Eubacteriaceae bacterium]
MIGYYNVSVILTYFSVVVSVYGTLFALNNQISFALLCLMVCGLCDMFDGTIAAKVDRTENEKKFGVQIDSLCDVLNFGMFPAIIGYAIGLRDFWSISCMAAFILAAVIRLAFFNVDEDIRQRETPDQSRAYYRGLPVTSVAMIIPFFVMGNAVITQFTLMVYYPILLLMLAFFFLLDFKVKKPKGISIWVMCFIGMIVFFIVYKWGELIV